jgi:D-alanine-D-alanine ligase
MQPLALIVHNRIPENAPEEELDLVHQINGVTASLQKQGWRVDTQTLTLDLASGRAAIAEKKPDCIFNLVESLDGDDRFIPAGPLLYESLGIPYTGSSSAAIAVTSNKLAAKRIMRAAGIPTAQWEPVTDASTPPLPYPFIIKTSTDHASVDIDDESVIYSIDGWHRWFERRGGAVRSGLFAERYIDGREYNLSVLELGRGTHRVLPPAEILFNNFPPGKPRIVGYAAKWEEQAFEYENTPRHFSDDPADAPLHERLVGIASSCWDLFRLGGYVRVDFRIDADGSPYVLEVNANPCIAPWAGFVAACDRAGISFDDMIRHLIDSALGR